MFYYMLCGKIAKYFCFKTFIPPVTGDNNTGVSVIVNFLAHGDTKLFRELRRDVRHANNHPGLVI